MRILFFSNVFPNSIDSTRGTFNLSLTRALAEQHQVEVVSPVSWVDEIAARFRRKGRVQRTKVLGDRLTATFPRYYYPPKICRSQYGTFLGWSVQRMLATKMQEFQPDAVVSFWTHPDGEVAVEAARRAGIPAVVMAGGSDVLLLTREGKRRNAILEVLNRADAVVAVSQDISRKLQADGIPPEKLHVITTGVDRRIFSPGSRQDARQRLNLPADKHVLLSIGRLVPVKGFDLLIEACRLLRDRNLPIACYVLGGGAQHAALAAQIDRLRLRQDVFLAGPQTQNNLPDWYRGADLTVLSSRSEGIPNVLLESICCGTPFVATRVGGVPEVADERFHGLVESENPAALAAAIERRLREPVSGPVTPRYVPLTWNQTADRMCNVIDNLRRSAATRDRSESASDRMPALTAPREG